jgi:hypothetical protein
MMSIPSFVWLSILLILPLAALVIFVWYFRYRFISMVRHEHTPDMVSQSLEGYTDKMFYFAGATVKFSLHSSSNANTLRVRRMKAPYEYEEVYSTSFGQRPQELRDEASEQGCSWKDSLEIALDERFNAGYYQALLTSDDGLAEFPIYFLIGTREKCKIAILAPVSTWTAYNPWGGKSLYQNKFEAKTVYHVSTERPNTAFQINHDIDVEANTFNWFAANYPEVGLFPDYILQSQPELLASCSIIVLVYHCEYITKAIYDNLEKLIDSGASMISLGSNQLYWRTRWDKNFTQMECRKDLTGFTSLFDYGGMWKHHFRPAHRFLGVEFSRSGMHTYAPYKVLKPQHWLFNGTNVQKGDLFGMKGINELPIAGVETDKAHGVRAEIEVIAHSMNCDSEVMGKSFDPNDPRWNGDGGGDLAIKYLEGNRAILSTAAIYSGSGLGTDSVFTQIMKNFVDRYLARNSE